MASKTETDCLKCMHISLNGIYTEEGGRRYSCDEKCVSPSYNKAISNTDCSGFEEHRNQRILGEYLLCFRVDK